ncbi:MAG: hypothetical protein WKG07_50180 [Hymenobacter sp.]
MATTRAATVAPRAAAVLREYPRQLGRGAVERGTGAPLDAAAHARAHGGGRRGDARCLPGRAGGHHSGGRRGGGPQCYSPRNALGRHLLLGDAQQPGPPGPARRARRGAGPHALRARGRPPERRFALPPACAPSWPPTPT